MAPAIHHAANLDAVLRQRCSSQLADSPFISAKKSICRQEVEFSVQRAPLVS